MPEEQVLLRLRRQELGEAQHVRQLLTVLVLVLAEAGGHVSLKVLQLLRCPLPVVDHYPQDEQLQIQPPHLMVYASLLDQIRN